MQYFLFLLEKRDQEYTTYGWNLIELLSNTFSITHLTICSSSIQMITQVKTNMF